MIEEKPWYLSKTIWGSMVAVAAALSAALGLTIDTTTQKEIADVLIQLAGAGGAVLAIYGRLSATQVIE